MYVCVSVCVFLHVCIWQRYQAYLYLRENFLPIYGRWIKANWCLSGCFHIKTCLTYFFLFVICIKSCKLLLSWCGCYLWFCLLSSSFTPPCPTPFGGKVSILMAFLCPSYNIIGRILDFNRNPFAEILFKEDIYCLMTMVRMRTILF